MNHHRSHQNGRDVDVGMYLRGNRGADTFVPMNEENLDVPKTWCLIEGLIRSQRVQYIFLDRRIQRLLYDYAAARGADSAFLERVFGGSRRAIINHVANHYDHIHVRFYTPWSTLAAHVAGNDEQKRTVIEMAQQAFLPKKVNYYVKGNEIVSRLWPKLRRTVPGSVPMEPAERRLGAFPGALPGLLQKRVRARTGSPGSGPDSQLRGPTSTVCCAASGPTQRSAGAIRFRCC